MGSRFINAGVAEQNMVSVAAALAKQDFEVWVYSIAPFLYGRPFEQIRNDICFHNLPVKLIGNGGGYGYGVMGPSHHAIDDYGVLLTLPNMSVYLPVFDEDMESIIERAGSSSRSAYIRMGRGEPPQEFFVPEYAPWRQLTHGKGPVVIVAGPLAGTYIEVFESMPTYTRPNLWVVSELPIEHNPVPAEIFEQLKNSKRLIVVEEHVRRGGVASELLLNFADKGVAVSNFCHHFAVAHRFERYGSQAFLRKQSGLDAASIISTVNSQ
jgi:transketolase